MGAAGSPDSPIGPGEITPAPGSAGDPGGGAVPTPLAWPLVVTSMGVKAGPALPVVLMEAELRLSRTLVL